jgi:hypothetical protein
MLQNKEYIILKEQITKLKIKNPNYSDGCRSDGCRRLDAGAHKFYSILSFVIA